MDWLERLNRGPGRIRIGGGTAELLHWAYAAHLPDNRPHRHTFFEICQVGAYGSGQFLVQGQAHLIGPGDLFIARPGVVHQIRNTARLQMELFWVSFQWLPDAETAESEVGALLRGFAESSLVVAPDEEGRLAALWQALRVTAGGRPRPGYAAQAESLIASLLLAIAQAGTDPQAAPVLEPGGPEAGDRAARFAVRYIHDNLNRPLSVAEIAAHVHISPRHLSRLFLHFTGTSPAAYIAHARMDRAGGLLLRTEMPIKEIAAEVGYPDIHYFTRLFTRAFRCPPGRYRQRGGPGHVPIVQKSGALV